MVGPDDLDRLVSPDAGSSRVAAWAEPVVLGGAGGPRSDAIVGGPVDGGAEDLVLELDVVGDDGGCQMV